MARQETIKALFEEMRNDIETMATFGDNESELLKELQTADSDILRTYCDIFLNN